MSFRTSFDGVGGGIVELNRNKHRQRVPANPELLIGIIAPLQEENTLKQESFGDESTVPHEATIEDERIHQADLPGQIHD